MRHVKPIRGSSRLRVLQCPANMEAAALIALVLLGLLVGVTIPVLVQLRATLRSTQSLLERTGPRLERALDDVSSAASRANRAAAEVEGGIQNCRVLFDAASDLAQSVGRMRESIHTAAAVGSAVGPALAAALRAFASPTDGDATARDRTHDDQRDPTRKETNR